MTSSLELLSKEVLVEVLRWVPPMDLLTKTALASTRFASLLREVPFWRNHDLLLVGDDDDRGGDRLLPRSFLNLHQLQRACMFVASRRASSSPEGALVAAPVCLELGSVLVNREAALRLAGRTRGTMRACLASTTDHANELVENTLEPPESEDAVANDWNAVPARVGLRMLWWSSAPTQENISTTETLVFATKYPAALISQISIKPMRDPHTFDTVYSWKNTIIRAYRLDGDSEGCSSGAPPSATLKVGFPCAFRSSEGTSISLASTQSCIDALLAEQTPVYESPAPIPCSDSASGWINFLLPECGVMANVICITLIGKHHRHWFDNAYYVGVEQVFVRGIPLYTHANQMKSRPISKAGSKLAASDGALAENNAPPQKVARLGEDG